MELPSNARGELMRPKGPVGWFVTFMKKKKKREINMFEHVKNIIFKTKICVFTVFRLKLLVYYYYRFFNPVFVYTACCFFLDLSTTFDATDGVVQHRLVPSGNTNLAPICGITIGPTDTTEPGCKNNLKRRPECPKRAFCKDSKTSQ